MTCAQYEGPVEDVAAIHGATVHGVMISVSSSWRGPADESTLLVVGTNGFLFGCGSAGTLAVRVGQETRTHDVVAPWSERDRSPEPMIADFVAACQEGRRPIATDPLWDVATRRVLEVYEGE
jgi:predicted dehydrogenase